MHENDDPPSDSVADENVNDDDPPQDSPESVAADVIENDDETNEQELDPDQVWDLLKCYHMLLLFIVRIFYVHF